MATVAWVVLILVLLVVAGFLLSKTSHAQIADMHTCRTDYANVDAPAFISHHFRSPSKVLGLPSSAVADPEVVRQRFFELYAVKRHVCTDAELQSLCSAFLYLMLGIRLHAQHPSNIVVSSCQVNASPAQTDAISHCCTEPQHALELQQRVTAAEQHNSTLEKALRVAEQQLQGLQHQLADRTAQLELAARRASCAPAFYDAVLSFVRCHCVQGDDLFVASAELHDACLMFLKSQKEEVQLPSQRELRALVEQLGFEYRQTWSKGKHMRGFRNLALRKSHETMSDHTM